MDLAAWRVDALTASIRCTSFFAERPIRDSIRRMLPISRRFTFFTSDDCCLPIFSADFNVVLGRTPDRRHLSLLSLRTRWRLGGPFWSFAIHCTSVPAFKSRVHGLGVLVALALRWSCGLISGDCPCRWDLPVTGHERPRCGK